jgi:hypothetical protein
LNPKRKYQPIQTIQRLHVKSPNIHIDAFAIIALRSYVKNKGDQKEYDISPVATARIKLAMVLNPIS